MPRDKLKQSGFVGKKLLLKSSRLTFGQGTEVNYSVAACMYFSLYNEGIL